MFRQEATGHVERANLIAYGIENLSGGRRSVHHADGVRTDAVIEERQRVQQYSPPITSKCLRELRDDSLCRAAQLVTKHDHDVAFSVCNRLSRCVDCARLNTGFLRCE